MAEQATAAASVGPPRSAFVRTKIAAAEAKLATVRNGARTQELQTAEAAPDIDGELHDFIEASGRLRRAEILLVGGRVENPRQIGLAREIDPFTRFGRHRAFLQLVYGPS